MNTSPQTLWKSVSCLEDAPINPAMIGYFQGSSQDLAHEVIVSTFMELSKSEGISKAFLARRLDKSPEQITRWLAAPGNWTLDTFTNLAIAMGFKPRFELERLRDLRNSNQHHPAVFDAMRFDVTSVPVAPSIQFQTLIAAVQ